MTERRFGTPYARAIARACALAFPAGVATGCYSRVPLADAPAPGTVVVLDVNDRGRVALDESLGPSVTHIEGRLQARSDTAYVVSVSSVEYLNGNRNQWSGEPVTIRTDHVGQATERRLSRGRTGLAIAVAAGATLAFILSRSIFASGTPGRDPTPGEPSSQ